MFERLRRPRAPVPAQTLPPLPGRSATRGVPPAALHRLGALPAEPAREPVQRKIHVLTGDQKYDQVNVLGAHLNEDVSALANAITNAETFTVRTDQDVQELAQGRQANVLRERRYVIGETHNASQFPRITGEWPGVPNVGEGVYSTEEREPDVRAGSVGQTTFRQNLNAAPNAPMQALENFHAAALGRLTAFLLIWNEYHNNQALNVQALFRTRVRDFQNLIAAYLNVSVAVYLKGMDNSWFGFSPRYKGTVEEAYGRMDTLLRSGESQQASADVDSVVNGMANNAPIPHISQTEYTRVRTLAAAMAPEIGNLLHVSLPAVRQQAIANDLQAATTYLSANATTMAGAQSGAALAAVAPLRERFMAEHIRALGRPSLVKVGTAHIAGLQNQHLSNTELFNNYAGFDQAVSVAANQLP